MRIALIVDSFPVLSETFILGQVVELIKRGHDVQLFARCKPPEAPIHQDVRRYNLVKRTHYLDAPFGALSAVGIGLRSPLRALKWLRKYREGLISLDRLNLLLPFFKDRFDIVHCHFGPNGHFGIFLKKAGIGIPVVTAFHGYDMSQVVVSEGRDVYKSLFEKGDLFLPVSEYWKRKLIELGCDESKIIVCHMGIDLRRFEYVPHARCAGEPVQLLSVGRLVEKKGHEYLIRALAKAVSSGRDINLTVAGDGPLKGKLVSLAGELNLSERVSFLGAIDQDAVAELFRTAHIFVLPSVTAANGDQEGIPVSIMEAQAMGMPVLSTLHSGIPELVADGRSGYLVNERDVEALADRLGYLVDHPDIWPELGAAGRKIVEAGFDLETGIDRLTEIYGKLIDNPT
jgi:colanic acid/amylovoran biosynthesis glycosyltransferase